jgi:hypothetical protein
LFESHASGAQGTRCDAAQTDPFRPRIGARRASIATLCYERYAPRKLFEMTNR